ncbi:MAG: RDD family protein [Actinomycetota bacterium]|nr:RDD family protein [Actinomycetota bacterium]
MRRAPPGRWRYVRRVGPGGGPTLSIASLRRRLLSCILDAGIIAGPVAIGMLVYERFPAVRQCVRNTALHSRVMRLVGPGGGPKLPARWRSAMWVVSIVGAVVGRNWRGPGSRILKIRRVDARTGGSVTVRSALIRFAAGEAWRLVSARFCAPWQRRAAQRLSELESALKDLQEVHREDSEALQRATIDFYRARDIDPLGSWLWPLPGVLMPQVPALSSERRQTAYDWLAGTVVVRQK